MLAGGIMAVTFLNPLHGLMGILGVLLGNMAAYLALYEKEEVREGYWGFNHLLVALYLASTFKLNLQFAVLFVSVHFLCFSFTFWIRNWANKAGLPYLSLPFILTSFVVMLSAGNIPNLQLSDSGIYTLNEQILESGSLTEKSNALLASFLPAFIQDFFHILSGIFFDKNLIGGLLITLSLLWWSRIAFLSALLAFGAAHLLFVFYGIPPQSLNESLTGANYVFFTLTYMCYYLVPGIIPLLLTIAFFPLLFFVNIFLGKILVVMQLKPFTLPFVSGIFISLSVLRLIRPFKGLHWVGHAYFSPEKNLYIDSVLTPLRTQLQTLPLRLPFYGQWMVSQGYAGGITHLGKWQKALDFVVLDEQMKTYADSGKETWDYYCYGKPVLAAAAGTVTAIEDTVDENLIGRTNTGANWGNSIVIQHAPGLCSQVSHLRPFSAQVRLGDYVYAGQIIGYCGNSGRSPEPHLHFQVQQEPFIGAVTMPWPFRHFIEQIDGQRRLCSGIVPSEGVFAETVDIDPALHEAMGFYPGYLLRFRDSQMQIHQWEVKTTALNETYLYCSETHSSAFFVFDGTLLQFTTFEGNRKSLLFHFFLIHYRILPGNYPQLPVNAVVSPLWMHIPLLGWLLDFVAPFVSIKGAAYSSVLQKSAQVHEFNYKVSCRFMFAGITARSYKGEITVENNRISKWSYHSGKKHFSVYSF